MQTLAKLQALESIEGGPVTGSPSTLVSGLLTS
jgi:hypothetical protein